MSNKTDATFHTGDERPISTPEEYLEKAQSFHQGTVMASLGVAGLGRQQELSLAISADTNALLAIAGFLQRIEEHLRPPPDLLLTMPTEAEVTAQCHIDADPANDLPEDKL